MAITDATLNYLRYVKTRNYSTHTVKNYMNSLKHFVIWLDEPIQEVTNRKILYYIDFLLDRRLKPKAVNCHLDNIRWFYNYLSDEGEL